MVQYANNKKGNNKNNTLTEVITYIIEGEPFFRNVSTDKYNI